MKYTITQVETNLKVEGDPDGETVIKWMACEGEFKEAKSFAQADTAIKALELLLRG